MTPLLLAAALLFSPPALAQAAGGASADEARRLFAEGKKLVEANCADCQGASQGALADGLAKLRQALEAGLTDKVAAYRALVDGYASLAFAFSRGDSPEQRAALEEQRRAYQDWLALEPRNIQVLYDYAFTFPQAADRLPVLERLLEIDPKHGEALFAVGEIDLEAGRVEAALAKMQKAFDGAQGELAVSLGERLLEVYELNRRPADAQRVRARLAAIKVELKRLEQGGQPG
ncbi:MAG: hypothetical protein U0002_06050 [Thermoanaerobaculia bacterium]